MVDPTLSEKIISPISNAELERRWRAARDRMRENKVDFIIASNREDYLGGYVKWLTDEPAMHCYPCSVILPLEDDTTTIAHGSSDPSKASPPEWALRGVVERPSFQSGETMKIAANMIIAAHPIGLGKRASAILTDNYTVGEHGVGPCIRKTPKKVFFL